jgi:deoxyadenosine/deoxycytidine kinase
MPSTIILIGPIGAGKSTIGQLLAQRLDLPQCSMDEKRWNYYREIGCDEDLARCKRETEGFWGIYQYWKPFEAYAVERLWQSIDMNALMQEIGLDSVFDDVLDRKSDAALMQCLVEQIDTATSVVNLLGQRSI